VKAAHFLVKTQSLYFHNAPEDVTDMMRGIQQRPTVTGLPKEILARANSSETSEMNGSVTID
jgi:hypothetical protein